MCTLIINQEVRLPIYFRTYLVSMMINSKVIRFDSHNCIFHGRRWYHASGEKLSHCYEWSMLRVFSLCKF